jgi:general secretion pathway protein C
MIKIAQLLLITALVFLGVKAFYGAITSEFDRTFIPTDQGVQKTEQKTEAVHPFSDYQTIANRNLFNTEEFGNKTTKTASIESLKRTQLKLKLWGTVTEDTGGSYAVIEDTKEKKQDLYQIGDKVQQATITNILREKVIFRVGDRDEILEMEDTYSNVKRIPAPATQKITKTNDITMNRDEVDEAVKDITTLMKQVKIRSHPDGLSLSGIAKKSIFSKMGLKNGDVIVGVDGRDIQTVDDALGLYDSLRDSSNVSVEIKRRGRFERVEYTIE